MLFVPLIIYVRSEVEHVKNTVRVDWDSLPIVETHDDEGQIALLRSIHGAKLWSCALLICLLGRGLAPRVLAERKSVACVVLYLWFLNF